MNRRLAVGICLLSTMFALHATAEDKPRAKAGLTNPSFEEPRGKEANFVLVETMPGWKTTDTHFEIWGTGFNDVAAYEGTQFVELNAYKDGTIYQDSTGIPRDSVLEFTFAHRGRSGIDTVRLTITDLGADNALDGGDDTLLFGRDYSTGKDAWAVYDSKAEELKALGNTVRFAFTAMSSAGGKVGEGNFLDTANFGNGVLGAAGYTNSIGMQFKLIPAGKFIMGSPESEKGRRPDETQHEVTITRDYHLGSTEVTQSQWQQVMKTTPWTEAGAQSAKNNPASNISWDDAAEFCRKLSDQEGREYRLPTEAEWEYACRAGSKTAYSFGDDEAALGDYAWGGEDGNKQLHSVGQKKPNAWGLYDMHGSVFEWCQEKYIAYPKEAVIDPYRDGIGPAPAEGSPGVLRGGAWCHAKDNCRSAFRFKFNLTLRPFTGGFRVALSPAGKVPKKLE